MLDEYLEQFRGKVAESGTFTVNVAKARIKLRQYLLRERHTYACHLVAAGIAWGASEVRVENDADDLVVEFEALPNRSKEGGLAGFWLDALWRFLEDNRRSTEAFEGMAFQALAERLDALEFERLYGRVRERLTLRPPQGIELLEAYRVLNGRVSSFAGVTTDGEFWTGFYQADVFELHPG